MDRVTPGDREKAKRVVYAIVYGVGKYAIMRAAVQLPEKMNLAQANCSVSVCLQGMYGKIYHLPMNAMQVKRS